jgi:hypothetical protein
MQFCHAEGKYFPDDEFTTNRIGVKIHKPPGKRSHPAGRGLPRLIRGLSRMMRRT